jgi:Regulator of ribonuclease activity B
MPDQSAGVYRAKICRVDLANLQTIDGITLPLYELAKELGGAYDGWGTLVSGQAGEGVRLWLAQLSSWGRGESLS